MVFGRGGESPSKMPNMVGLFSLDNNRPIPNPAVQDLKVRSHIRKLTVCHTVSYPVAALQQLPQRGWVASSSNTVIPTKKGTLSDSFGAVNETRTRDPNLGKVMLYQLSYHRKIVKRMRLELTRHRCHYPLKVACLPIPPSLQNLCPKQDSNLHALRHTHLKRARLPIPPLGQSS